MDLSTQMTIREARRLASFVAGGLCLLMFLNLLAPWQSLDFDFVEVSQNGLRGWGLLTLIALIGVGAGAVLCLTVTAPPAERRALGFVMLVSGGVITLSTLIHVAAVDEFRTGWVWLGLLLSIPTGALGVALGGSLAFIASEDDGHAVARAWDLVRQNRGARPATFATSPDPAAAPAAGWYDDPERPGGKRWWDGGQWGMTDAEYHATESAPGES
jgi:Protein of unknown function (DUF2510)